MFKLKASASGEGLGKLTNDLKLVKGIKMVMSKNKMINAFISDDLKAQQDLQILRDILQAEEKAQTSLLTIYGICHKMPFFTKLSNQIMKKVSSREVFLKFFERASYEYHPKGTLLIQEYDTLNTKAYVILRGKVGVLRHNRETADEIASPHRINSPTSMNRIKPKQSLDQPQLLKKASGSSNIVQQVSPGKSNKCLTLTKSPLMQYQQQLSQPEPNKENDHHNDDLYHGIDRNTKSFLNFYGSLVAKIGKGNMFGDIALTSDVPRTASVATLEDTELMIFTRENFQHIQKYYAMEFDDRKRFIKARLPQVEEIDGEKRLTQFIQSFQPVTMRRVELINAGRYGN